MTNEELKTLRDKIITDITPLVVENAGDGVDRFSLLLRVIQGGNANQEIYQHAYESAHKIEDSKDRLQALLSLLDEVDIDLTQPPQVSAAQEQTPNLPSAEQIPDDQPQSIESNQAENSSY